MTFKKIMKTLPNGLHDAMLSSVNIDYTTRTVTLTMNIWIGNLDSKIEEEREKYRPATIIISRFSNCIIEPPDYRLEADQKEIMIDAGMFPHEKLKAPEKIFRKSNSNDEQYWIYSSHLNSFIFISAQNAELNWRERGA